MRRSKGRRRKENPPPLSEEWPGDTPYDDLDDEEFLDDIPLPNF